MKRSSVDASRSVKGSMRTSAAHAHSPTSIALSKSLEAKPLAVLREIVPPTPAWPFSNVMVSNSTSRGPRLRSSARQSIMLRSWAMANSRRAGKFWSGQPTMQPSTVTILQSPTPLMTPCR